MVNSCNICTIFTVDSWCETEGNFLFTCCLFDFYSEASADKVSIASKEASHVVDVKEPKKSKKKVKTSLLIINCHTSKRK